MTIFFDLIYILVFPFFALGMTLKGKWHDGMAFRLGNIPDSFRSGLIDCPRIWIHAVSAGEVLAVAGFIRRLSAEYPDHQIICSTVTRTGFELASSRLQGAAVVIYAPVDFSRVVRTFVDVIRPRIYLSAETEVWPNLYRCLAKRNIPVVLINGRISDGSFRHYRLGKFLFQSALRCVRAFAMQTQEDARRIIALGADPSAVQVAGNLKFDTITDGPADQAYDAWAVNRIFLAGSTHPGEEEIVLDAFERLRLKWPDMRLMIAPRHIERTDQVMECVKRRNLRAVRLSGTGGVWPENSVMIVDQMGRLRHLYKIAAVVFIGKTFKAGGGQNMIEPLAFGRPTFTGPLTQNFKDVAAIFERAGVLFRVGKPGDLAQAMIRVLDDPPEVERIRAAAPQVIRAHQGATERLIQIVKGL